MPNTRDTFFREHPDRRIGLPLNGPVQTTIEGELAQARSTIAQLDDETDTLRMELANERDQTRALHKRIERLQQQIADQTVTISRFQEWTGEIRPHLDITDAPSYKTLGYRISRALDILHGIEPGE